MVNHLAIHDLETEKEQIKSRESIINAIAKSEKLNQVRPDSEPYQSRYNQPVRPSTGKYSPYFLAPDSAPTDKTFITGYTGYIPQSKFLPVSKVYQDQTNEALDRFTADQIRNKRDVERNISAESCLSNRLVTFGDSASGPIYRKNQGLVPKYTGHLPGHKYRYGVSWAKSAKAFTS